VKYFNYLPIVILLKNYTAMPQNCDVWASIAMKNRAIAAELPRHAAMHASKAH
jgi:hypothetical protein